MSAKYGIVGVCDWVNICSCCGRSDLKRTVVMEDSEGEYHWFGTTCAKKVNGYTKKAMDRAISTQIRDVTVNGSTYRLIIAGGVAQEIKIHWQNTWKDATSTMLKLDILESGERKDLLNII